jgi:hypothetical protein
MRFGVSGSPLSPGGSAAARRGRAASRQAAVSPQKHVRWAGKQAGQVDWMPAGVPAPAPPRPDPPVSAHTKTKAVAKSGARCLRQRILRSKARAGGFKKAPKPNGGDAAASISPRAEKTPRQQVGRKAGAPKTAANERPDPPSCRSSLQAVRWFSG